MHHQDPIEAHRGMLWTAAWTVRDHPTLKFAVWNETGAISEKDLDEGNNRNMDITLNIDMTATKPAYAGKGVEELFLEGCSVVADAEGYMLEGHLSVCIGGVGSARADHNFDILQRTAEVILRADSNLGPSSLQETSCGEEALRESETIFLNLA